MWAAIFWSFCLFCLIFHVSEISLDYFAYTASAKVRLDIPQNVTLPSLSACWRYADVLSNEFLTRINQQPVNFDNSDTTGQTVNKIQSLVTLKDINDHTPQIDDLYLDCIIRFPREYVIQWFKKDECKAHFRIEKFVSQQFVCYRLQLTGDGSYDYSTVAASLAFPGMSFLFTFDINKFKQAQLVKPIVHLRDTWPFRDVYFAPELRRFNTLDQQEKFTNFIYMSYQAFKYERLPPPFSTQCHHYDGTSQDECFKRCIIQRTLQQFKLLPFTELYIPRLDSVPLDKQIISNYFTNETHNARLLKSLEQECDHKCHWVDCESTFFVSVVRSLGSRDDGISFRANVPCYPSYQLVYQAVMPLYEYITFVLSLTGTWLGLSIFNLNPIAYVVNYIRKRRSNDVRESRTRSRPLAPSNVYYGYSYANYDLGHNANTRLELELMKEKLKKIESEFDYCKLKHRLR